MEAEYKEIMKDIRKNADDRIENLSDDLCERLSGAMRSLAKPFEEKLTVSSQELFSRIGELEQPEALEQISERLNEVTRGQKELDKLLESQTCDITVIKENLTSESLTLKEILADLKTLNAELENMKNSIWENKYQITEVRNNTSKYEQTTTTVASNLHQNIQNLVTQQTTQYCERLRILTYGIQTSIIFSILSILTAVILHFV